MDVNRLLSQIYLFKNLSVEQIEELVAITELKTYSPGEEIFIQGDTAEAFYLIVYGSVKISQSTGDGDQIDLSIFGTGSHFGEMAFVDGEKRSATATATERSEIICIPYGQLESLLLKNPQIGLQFYRSLAHFLSGRLRVTTENLSFAREKNLKHF